MSTATASLREIATASTDDPLELMELLLDRMTDQLDRKVFLHGLTERVYALRDAAPAGEAEAIFELHKWIGSWWISLNLLDDPDWVAADAEASGLIDTGDLGSGITASDLRARYGHR